jgi:hypothetical protein
VNGLNAQEKRTKSSTGCIGRATDVYLLILVVLHEPESPGPHGQTAQQGICAPELPCWPFKMEPMACRIRAILRNQDKTRRGKCGGVGVFVDWELWRTVCVCVWEEVAVDHLWCRR